MEKRKKKKKVVIYKDVESTWFTKKNNTTFDSGSPFVIFSWLSILLN